MRHKVSVIGAGYVGSTVAQRIAEKELADVVLLDIDEGIAKGKALDMWQSGPIEDFATSVIGTKEYEDIRDSQIVVITAGSPRKPHMSREDLMFLNAKTVGHAAENVRRFAPNSMIIVVTNPLDIMTYCAFQKAGFPANRVFGMSGVLDTARYKTFLADEMGVSVLDIQAMVLGGHGDEMVPLVQYATVSGIPITELIPREAIDKIVERTRKGGGEIVNLLKTGSAYYAPSAAACQMVEAVLKDKKRLMPASAYLNGQYGMKDICVGVPVIIGANGIEKIIELDLSAEELTQLQKSAQTIAENIQKLNAINGASSQEIEETCGAIEALKNTLNVGVLSAR